MVKFRGRLAILKTYVILQRSMTKLNQNNRYLVYARKSTDDAENQKNSIDYQVGECLRYAKSNGLVVTDYSLEGFSDGGVIREKHTAYKTSDITINKDGLIIYKIERPKFKKMVDLLLAKEFAGVICLCWDRVSRNDQDGMVIKNLIKFGIDVRFVQTKYEKTSSGALHMDIDGMFAAHYSRVISEKVKAAYSKLQSEGKCTYIAPIGYLDKGSDNKPLDSERAPVVKKIFELYASGGWSLSQLAKWANQQGLTSKPSRTKRTPQEVLSGQENIRHKIGRPINEKSIELILKNPFYVGKLKVGGDIIDGIHQPLIDLSLFNRVQDVLKSRNVKVYYVDKEFYTYRGLITCTCGRSYSPYRKKGIVYYRCRCKAGCTSVDKNLNESEINDRIRDLLEQVHFSDQELQEIESRAKFGLQDVSERRNRELEALNKQRKRVYDDLDYLQTNKITLLRTNTYTIQQFGEDVVKLQKELDEIEEKSKAYKEATMDMLKYVINFSELVKEAKLYYENALDTEKRDITLSVFSELTFHNGNLSNFKAKEGFAALFNRRSMLSGSEGGIRTRDQEINSLLRYRCATSEYCF